MVIPEGLEPPTYRLGICRSILMSYGTTSDICRNLRANARCSATPLSIGIRHAISAWAKAGSAGSKLTSKEQMCTALHPLARSTIQPPMDSKVIISTIGHLPGHNHPTQHLFIKGVMANHYISHFDNTFRGSRHCTVTRRSQWQHHQNLLKPHAK